MTWRRLAGIAGLVALGATVMHLTKTMRQRGVKAVGSTLKKQAGF